MTTGKVFVVLNFKRVFLTIQKECRKNIEGSNFPKKSQTLSPHTSTFQNLAKFSKKASSTPKNNSKHYNQKNLQSPPPHHHPDGPSDKGKNPEKLSDFFLT